MSIRKEGEPEARRASGGKKEAKRISEQKITYEDLLDSLAEVMDLGDSELRELGFERFRQQDEGWMGSSGKMIVGLGEDVRRELGLAEGEDRRHRPMVIIHEDALQAHLYKGDDGKDWRGEKENWQTPEGEKRFLLCLGEAFLGAKARASDYQQMIFDLLLRKGNAIAGYLRRVKDDKVRDSFRKMIADQKSFTIEKTLVFMCRPEDDAWRGEQSLWSRIIKKTNPDLLKKINLQVELIKSTLTKADLTEDDLPKRDFRSRRRVAALWKKALLIFWQQYLEPHVKGDERGFLYLSKIRRGEPSSKQGNIMTFIVKGAESRGISLLEMALLLGAHEGFHGAQWSEERWFFDNVLFKPLMRQAGVDVAVSLYGRPEDWYRERRRIWGIESVICFLAGLGMYTPVFEGLQAAFSGDHSPAGGGPDFCHFWHNPCGRRLNGRIVDLAESIYYGGARFFWALILTRKRDMTFGEASRKIVGVMLEAAAETGDFGRKFPADLRRRNRRVTAFFERVVEKLEVEWDGWESEEAVVAKGKSGSDEAQRGREQEKKKRILEMVYNEVVPGLAEVFKKIPPPLIDQEVLFGDKREIGDYLDLLAGLR